MVQFEFPQASRDFRTAVDLGHGHKEEACSEAETETSEANAPRRCEPDRSADRSRSYEGVGTISGDAAPSGNANFLAVVEIAPFAAS